ncbi:MAG: hypothetical protein ACI4SS_02360, partial [Clostridia bacterium]
MKKRVLSIVLALALCFTMFASMGSAAVNVERVITAAGNMLNDATPEQKAVIESVVGAQEAVNIGNDPWKALVNGELIVDEIFADEETVLPYFMMRYIQNNVDDLSATPTIEAAMADFEAIDIRYNTAGLGFKASVDMFDGYSSAISAVCERIMEAESEFSTIFSGMTTDEVKETVKAYSREAVVDAFGYVSNLVFSATGEDISTAYDEIMASDITKKNAAIVIGRDILKKVANLKAATLKEYVKAEKGNYLDIFNSNKAALFSSDKDVAVDAIYTFAKEVAEKVESDAAVYSEIGDIVNLFTTRGFAPTKVVNALDFTMGYTDAGSEFQVIWYDLILGRLLTIEEDTEDGVFVPGEYIDFNLSHRYVDRMLGTRPSLYVSDYVYIVPSDENVTIQYDGYSGYTIEYDTKKVPATVDFTVYRGSAEENADVYRYIGKYTINLKVETDTKSISVNEITGKVKPGDIVTIKGTAEGFD